MKTFLVTGSDRGIGEALCREIHVRGERVLAACLDDSEKLRADGVRVEPAIDVTSDRADILSADATVRLAPWNRWDRALRRSPPVVFTSPQWAASPDSSFPTSCCTFASRFTASSATRSFPSTHGSIPTRPIFLKKTTAVSRRKRRPPVSGVSARRKDTAEGASMLDCIGGAAAPRAPCCVPASREAIAAPRSRDHAELSTRQSPRPSPVEACKALDRRQGRAVGIDGGDVLVVVADLERRVEILRHWADMASRSKGASCRKLGFRLATGWAGRSSFLQVLRPVRQIFLQSSPQADC
jgi:hypothetical protein